jgi:hypothetical protein
MSKPTICTVLNLSILVLVWAGFVILPNCLLPDRLGILSNVVLVVIGLVASGYLVQHFIAGFINTAIYGKSPSSRDE